MKKLNKELEQLQNPRMYSFDEVKKLMVEARKKENEAWRSHKRCSICGRPMKPKITTDICNKCFEEG